MSKIKIAVSPHYRGNGWTDRGTGITFEPQGAQLKTRTIDLDKEEDVSGIKNSVRLNHLLVLEGSFLEDTPDKPNKLNPEELTGEELDELVGNGSGDEALKEENKELKKQIKELEDKIKELEEKEVPSVSEVSAFKLNQDGSLDKKALDNKYTKAELVDIAKDKNIKHNKNITKTDLIDLMAKELDK